MKDNPFPEEAHLEIKEIYTKEEIDTIDVFWCKECCSLNIRRLGLSTNSSYCEKCGNTEIMQGPLKQWESYKKYKNK